MKVVAVGETTNYYMINYSGYNTVSNTAYIPKTSVDIADKGIIATVTQNSYAYDAEGNQLFEVNNDEAFAISEIDSSAEMVKATYEYQTAESNNYSLATKEIYLKYEDVTFDMDCAVTATANEGGSAISSLAVVKFNQPVKLTATANEGYTFEGWYLGETKISSKAEYTVLVNQESIDYVAKFTINSYTVAITKEGEGTAAASSETVNYNGSITLTATASDGYSFKGWYNGDEQISTELTYELKDIKANVNVKAVFTANIVDETPSKGCKSSADANSIAIISIICLLFVSVLILKRKQKN